MLVVRVIVMPKLSITRSLVCVNYFPSVGTHAGVVFSILGRYLSKVSWLGTRPAHFGFFR